MHLASDGWEKGQHMAFPPLGGWINWKAREIGTESWMEAMDIHNGLQSQVFGCDLGVAENYKVPKWLRTKIRLIKLFTTF